MYGRDGDLISLNKARNNPNLSDFDRKRVDDAHKTIVEQLKDKKLMGMRSRLIKAAIAQDDIESAKIQSLMREYTGEDRETGL